VLAAEPSSGTITKDRLVVDWGGQASGAATWAANLLLFRSGQPMLACVAPMCDQYDLTLRATGPLEVEASSCDEYHAQIQVDLPGGGSAFADGSRYGSRTIVAIPNAIEGHYVVRIAMGSPGDPGGGYNGHARLTPPETDPGSPPLKPSPSTKPSRSQPKLVVKTRTAKPTRSRRLVVLLSASGETTQVTATLRRGNRTVGRGKLG
jgi:hypothetical protein